jgi:hypothetical protein
MELLLKEPLHPSAKKTQIYRGREKMDEKTKFLKIALATPRDFEGEPVPLVPFADWDYYYTKGLIDWKPDDPAAPVPSVKVPSGFITDLTSVPRPFWVILPPQGLYAYPAIVHDYLYWTQPCDRATADLVLKLAMQDMKVGSVKVETIYNSVRLFGKGPWALNAQAKANGESRLLKVFPTQMRISWAVWKADPGHFLH